MSYFRELAEEGPVIGCVCIWLAGVLFWFSHVVYVAIPHVIICLCLGKEIEQIKKKNPKRPLNQHIQYASISVYTDPLSRHLPPLNPFSTGHRYFM